MSHTRKPAIRRRCGQTGFNPNADTNNDCSVDLLDLAFISRSVGLPVPASPDFLRAQHWRSTLRPARSKSRGGNSTTAYSQTRSSPFVPPTGERPSQHQLSSQHSAPSNSARSKTEPSAPTRFQRWPSTEPVAPIWRGRLVVSRPTGRVATAVSSCRRRKTASPGHPR